MINIESESKIYLQREERTKWFQEARLLKDGSEIKVELELL